MTSPGPCTHSDCAFAWFVYAAALNHLHIRCPSKSTFCMILVQPLSIWTCWQEVDFKHGNKCLESDPHPGRPVTVTTDKNLCQTIKCQLMRGPHILTNCIFVWQSPTQKWLCLCQKPYLSSWPDIIWLEEPYKYESLFWEFESYIQLWPFNHEAGPFTF